MKFIIVIIFIILTAFCVQNWQNSNILKTMDKKLYCLERGMIYVGNDLCYNQ